MGIEAGRLHGARAAAMHAVYDRVPSVNEVRNIMNPPKPQELDKVHTPEYLLRNDTSRNWIIALPSPTFPGEGRAQGMRMIVGAFTPLKTLETQNSAKEWNAGPNPVYFDLILTGGAKIDDPDVPTFVFADTERDRLCAAENRERFESMLNHPKARIIARRTAVRFTSHKNDFITPHDDPGGEVFAQTVTGFLNDHNLAEPHYEQEPTPAESKKVLLEGDGFTIYEGREIKTPWTEEQNYLYPIYFKDENGEIFDYVEVLTNRPLEEMIANPHEDKTVAFESLCTCMLSGRKGCDCSDSFPDRFQYIFPLNRNNAQQKREGGRPDGLFFLGWLQTTMGLGEVVGDAEHLERAYEAGVLADGINPLDPTNLDMRLRTFNIAQTAELDLREFGHYSPVLALLRGDQATVETMRIASQHRGKVGAVTGAGFAARGEYTSKILPSNGEVYAKLRNNSNYSNVA